MVRVLRDTARALQPEVSWTGRHGRGCMHEGCMQLFEGHCLSSEGPSARPFTKDFAPLNSMIKYE